MAKQAANLTGLVTVVYVEVWGPAVFGTGTTTDRALTFLLRKHNVVVGDGDAEVLPVVLFSDCVGTTRTPLSVRGFIRLNLFGRPGTSSRTPESVDVVAFVGAALSLIAVSAKTRRPFAANAPVLGALNVVGTFHILIVPLIALLST